MIYMYILLVISAAIFIVSDFFINGLDSFKKWEFYVWMFVITFNSYALLTYKSGPV